MGAKKRVIVPLIITVALIGAFLYTWRYVSKNDYVFKINDQKVTLSEFNPYLRIQKKILELERGENVWNTLIDEVPAIETARNDAKKSIVETVIGIQKAKERKIFVTNEEKQQIRDIIDGSIEEFNAQFNYYGITKEEFIKMNEEALILNKLAIALYKETDHTSHNHGEIDIESYENGQESPNATTFNSRHILFSTSGKTDVEKNVIKKKAEAVLVRAKNGEDFGKLAKEFSEDPGSKDNGGLYENITKGQFVLEYENAVLSIKNGEIYPTLVESSHGYHIIKSEGVKEGTLSYTEASNIINIELEEMIETWKEELEKEDKIEINEQQYNSAQ